MRSSQAYGWAWRGALALFILAGLTGILYRAGLSYGVTAGLDLVNIRHAHSHLMYFGWVTPALFALISLQLSARTGRPLPRGLGGVLAATFGAALLSYPLFLAFGYTPVAIGGARLPIAVIGSTLNMVAWGFFVALYRRATRGVPRTRSLLLWDLALTFLVLATLGAGGLALLKPLGIQDPAWSTALTHIFLDFFSEGWFVLSVLGLGYAALREQGETPGHWSLYLLCLGLPLTFALGMPSSLVPPGLRVVAKLGGVAVGVGLLANVWILWRAAPQRAWLWRLPLLLLGLKAGGQLVVGLLPGVWWASLHGFRILYLHLMLLGFVTLGLVAAATYTWGREATAGRAWFYGAVCAVLASLVPLTSLWPDAWSGRWAFVLATWLAFTPVLAAGRMLVGTPRPAERTPAARHPVQRSEASGRPIAPVNQIRTPLCRTL